MSPLEEMFIKRAKRRGWHPLRAGWPDFLLVKQLDNGTFEFLAVEVKQDHIDDKPREGQRLMLAAIALQGIPTYVWSGETTTLRRITQKDAHALMSEYFQRLEQYKTRDKLKELEALGVKIRWTY